MQKIIDALNSIGPVPVSLFLIVLAYVGYIFGHKYGINAEETSMIIGVALRHLFTDSTPKN